jgi:uncharacterized protein involved in exopolysaccharide biosynthesis
LPDYSTAVQAESAVALPFNAAYDPNQGVGMSLTQLLTILRAYWKLSLMIAFAVIFTTGVALKILPKTYTATATLIVNTENRDPLAGQQFPAEVLGNYVATQTELMLSPVILLQVVDRLNLTADSRYTAGLRSTDPTAKREYAEKNLAEDLLIETGRGGQLLYISASSPDTAKAANIANAVADVYLEQQKQRITQPAGERAQRYSEELAELRDKAAAAQDKVTEYRKRNGITDVGTANGDTAMLGLVNLQAKLLEAQSQRRALEAKRTGAQSTTDEALASTQVTGLKSQIADLEAQLAQKSATLGARHPQVLELTSRLEATRRSLNAALATLSQNNSTELVRARELEDTLTRAVADERQRVLGLHQLEGEGEKLTLELESAQAVYKRALDGYDQIMFASVGHNNNVTFISRATPPLKPSKPNKLKVLALGLFMGIALGVVGPLGYELLVNRRLRCRDDLERDFGIPVLAQFERIPAVAT